MSSLGHYTTRQVNAHALGINHGYTLDVYRDMKHNGTVIIDEFENRISPQALERLIRHHGYQDIPLQFVSGITPTKQGEQVRPVDQKRVKLDNLIAHYYHKK